MSTEHDDIVVGPETTQVQDDADEELKRLDLCFCLDVTASMGSYIESARENVRNIMTSIVKAEKCDVRFAMVVYRDHPPQDRTFVTETLDFNSDLSAAQEYLDSLRAQGGGDGPEAVGAALCAVRELSWREDDADGEIAKVCVCIADAPPHGLGERGDGFPQGPPDGSDAVAAAAAIADAGIVVYSVGCEPSLSNSYQYAADFFASLAERTSGQFLPLGSAALLADVVVGGAQEQLALAELQRSIDAEVTAIRAERPELRDAEEDDERLATELAQRLQSKGVRTRQMEVDTPYAEFEQHNVEALVAATSLSDVTMRQSKKTFKASFASSVGSSRARPGRRMKKMKRPASKKASGGGVFSSVMSFFGSSSSTRAATDECEIDDCALEVCEESCASDDDSDLRACAAAPSAAPAPAPQAVSNSVESISYAQVNRVMKLRKNKKRAY